MNRLDRERQAQVIVALVEGNSINATIRMTGISKVTILKLLKDVGTACDTYQGRVLRGLKCQRIQCDEICSTAMPRKRTFRLTRRLNSDMETFGLGLRLTRIPSWCQHSSQGTETRFPLAYSSTIWLHGLPLAFR
jgi:hypothetical protein